MPRTANFRASHTGPDTASMSLTEIMELRKLRTRLTELVKSDKIAFRKETDCTVHCDSCNDSPVWSDGYYYQDENGKDVWREGKLRTLSVINIQDADPALPKALLCARCFRALWCNVAKTNILRSGSGSCHSSIPGSQRSYDGGNFSSGEW